jgi:hypothetical protein
VSDKTRRAACCCLPQWLLVAGCALFVWTAAPAAGAQAAAPALLHGPGSLAGIWLTTGYKSSRVSARSRVVVTAEGKPAPLLPAAAALLDQRLADSDRGYPYPSTLASCLPGGMPLMIIAGAPYPIQILENPGQVSMLFEEQNHFRIIHLNAQHPEDPDPTFMGHSIGHWEGDTLVVDTIGLSERTTIDQVGMPHSEDLHLVERYRRLDKDTLEVRVTLTDPQTFSSAWQARAVYKSAPADTEFGEEYICENNRNTPDAQGHMGFQR